MKLHLPKGGSGGGSGSGGGGGSGGGDGRNRSQSLSKATATGVNLTDGRDPEVLSALQNAVNIWVVAKEDSEVNHHFTDAVTTSMQIFLPLTHQYAHHFTPCHVLLNHIRKPNPITSFNTFTQPINLT